MGSVIIDGGLGAGTLRSVARVLVAAGGGGDVVAAPVVHAALGGDEAGQVATATYAWDRLLVDPLPGPRAPADFRGLRPVGARNYQVTQATTPRPPAGSTLPRLAGELDARLLLLDPCGGAPGMRAQLRELVRLLQAEQVCVVDVGGDVVARGDEPTLRSPLADALVLAACTDLGVPVEVLVAGPGLDGELSTADVLTRCRTTLRGHLAGRLDDRHVAPMLTTLDWHPSEATALLAAAALGVRGTVEIRESGSVVQLTGDSRCVYAMDHAEVLAGNPVAQALLHTQSLVEAEAAVRDVCGRCEIDDERRKAGRVARRPPVAPLPELAERVRRYEAEARSRGVGYVTFRRLAEVLELSWAQAERLRRHLLATRPEQYEPPLWSVRHHRHC